MFIDVIPERYGGLFDSVYNYLLSYEYVNFGVALDFKNRISAKPSKGRVIVIEARLAGLADARQLMYTRESSWSISTTLVIYTS
ncbi:hypothetical protein RDI58_024398 [Solanum bulbocastanum]|uniref:Uncharacterized protein n=1 Tax=Solanum bulbocastanum TaxID=147425 RepID=A0AAN8SXK7_SOLBU